MKTILVTGGAGFIGSTFLNMMVKRYPDIRFINVDKLTYAANLHNLKEIESLDNYDFVQCDIADALTVHRVFEQYKPDTVVHFAAESHVDRSILTPGAFIKTNILGTYNLLEACRQLWQTVAEGKIFHHISTDEVYGSLSETGLFTEMSRLDPSSPYSASKASSDLLVKAYHKTYHLPVKLTNCSNNYGPRQFPEKLIPLIILNALASKPLPVYGNGKNVRDWLYVDDHCEAIWLVMTEGRLGETYNVGGNCEMKNIDVVESICQIVAEESGCDTEELRRLITFVDDRPGHDLRYAVDTLKISTELGWAPKETFNSGLRKTVRWYMENSEWIDKAISRK
ncbi:dTDP-glucose 4,6-dehydratase [Heliobacterium gestii]|uniref:dTDP-glucose 4,6-dehydratase n=1 Tax=Heliomicrobium gestii TaxID=2699 RepID=A0A845LCL8_HELGE|nr:dTDP-glucose 4,6-dehydratase [Heliomicrobium gestii]MBM7866616.1 dTDP-glucose 4,6-dehydratase [Heliomicrobium gestii]MZP43104.1 dTDP-glucose 4,6-dehydratase [Heliomicrobium gestii]